MTTYSVEIVLDGDDRPPFKLTGSFDSDKNPLTIMRQMFHAIQAPDDTAPRMDFGTPWDKPRPKSILFDEPTHTLTRRKDRK